MKSDFGRAVADAADLEDIAACRELGKMELSVRPGGCRSAGSEKRNLDLGQGLAALRIGDDSANVCCDDGSGCGKGAEKGQEGKVKKGKCKKWFGQRLSSDDWAGFHGALRVVWRLSKTVR